MKTPNTRLRYVILVFIVASLILLSLNYSVFLEEQQYEVEIRGSTIQDDDDKLKKDSCSGRYIYVHDLPKKFNDDVIKDCKSMVVWTNMCPYMINSGFGPNLINGNTSSHNGLVDISPYSKKSWFNTYQFILEVIFRQNLKTYKCLTNNSSMASVIYVPFYPGCDVSRYLWGYNTSMRDALSNELVVWLRGKPEWKRMSGRDHFMVSGRIGWDLHRQTDVESHWGNNLLSLPETKNMTVLSIEKSSWNENEFALPYPTAFHPSTRGEVVEWQKRVENEKRRYLFCFAGAPRPQMDGSIRGEIIKQCLLSGNECHLLDCSPPRKICDDPLVVIEAFRKSVFCLQPPGDSKTRRSIFDSILTGCIPVFFDPMSAYEQYTWYFPKNYSRYSVYIPEEGVKAGKTDIKETLGRVSEDEVLSMRNEVVKLIPKILYARRGTGSLETLEDAMDIAIDRVIERVEKVRKTI